MKMRTVFWEVTCCPYCIQAVRSRGEVLLGSVDIGEGKCDLCDEVDELTACLWEVE